MIFSKHSKASAHLSKEGFADLALSLRPGEAHPPADTRDWALAHIGLFKDQLIRLERSMAFISDSVPPSRFEEQYESLLTAIGKAATDDNARTIVEILACILNRINHLSCQVIDSLKKYQEVCMELQEANLEASEAFVPLCSHDELATLYAKVSVIENRRLLQQFRKLGYQKGKKLWSDDVMATEDAEFDRLNKWNLARMRAREENDEKVNAVEGEKEQAEKATAEKAI